MSIYIMSAPSEWSNANAEMSSGPRCCFRGESVDLAKMRSD